MWLANPFASPLFAPLATLLAQVLLAGLAALMVAVRGHLRALNHNSLFVRWRTWLLIAPLFSLAVLAGPLGVALLASLIGVLCAFEYATLADLSRSERALLALAALAAPAVGLLGAWIMLPLLLLALPLATLPALLAQDTERGGRRSARLAFGLLYLPLGLATLVLLDQQPHGGPGLLLALGLAVALSDVGAFSVGGLFGRHALAPRLSPNKTLAGVFGNLLGAALGLALCASLLPAGFPWPVLAFIVAVGAVWGDLVESLLKREANRKDAGAWLPGFGGLLDRVDSLLLVLPLTFTWLLLGLGVPH